MGKNGAQPDSYSLNHLISLMSVYLSEWVSRCELLWSHIFKFFYATLIVLFLPNIAGFIQIDLSAIPSVTFPVIAVVMSLVFLYVALGDGKRLEAISKTYQNMINLLPSEELKRLTLINPKIKAGKLFNAPLNYVTTFLMFSALLAMSIIMIMYNVHH